MTALILEWLKDGSVILVLIATALRIDRQVNRIEKLFRDYPPHRHILKQDGSERGCKILYPSEYTPSHID